MQVIASPAGDLDRERNLAAARRRATALLALVAAIFVATFWMGDATWVGFLRSTAEAAVIGGIADWFAVVALFRHPLGVPIPHTAVIPRSKDGLGANLADFVEANFLDPEQLSQRLADADVATRLGRWLVDPDNARQAAARVAEVLVVVLDDLDDEALTDELADLAARGVQALPVAEATGRGLQAAIADGQHRPLLTAAIEGLRSAVVDNRQVLRQRLYRESPWWVPEAVDDVVFDRASLALVRFLGELAEQPDHELRRAVDLRLVDLAHRLRHDPALAAAITDRLADLATNDALRTWAAGTWREVAMTVRTAADRPDSQLRAQLQERLDALGHRLLVDQALRARIDEWTGSVAPVVAASSGKEITGLIASTVDRWDPRETSHRLELWLGRDLQFVRINGTLVGGLVGLAIHTAVTLLT